MPGGQSRWSAGKDLSWEPLRALCIERLNHAHASGLLERQRHLGPLLYRTRELAGDGAPAAYVRDIVATPAGAVRILAAFLHRVTVLPLEHRLIHAGRVGDVLHLKEVERFVSVQDLEKRVSVLDLTTLDDDGRRAVSAFREALDRREQGVSDEGEPGTVARARTTKRVKGSTTDVHR